jgi:hypothetical protein
MINLSDASDLDQVGTFQDVDGNPVRCYDDVVLLCHAKPDGEVTSPYTIPPGTTATVLMFGKSSGLTHLEYYWPNESFGITYARTNELRLHVRNEDKHPRPGLTNLYRPVGSKELALIQAGGWTGFPPRLPEQPIFYPVTNEAYARKIARDCNARQNDDHRGHVTRFFVRTDFLAHYERKIVGGREHEEYWIPAEDLEAFNNAIVGPIEVLATYEGRVG